MIVVAIVGTSLFGFGCGLVVAFQIGAWALERDKRRILRIIRSRKPDERDEIARIVCEKLREIV